MLDTDWRFELMSLSVWLFCDNDACPLAKTFTVGKPYREWNRCIRVTTRFLLVSLAVEEVRVNILVAHRNTMTAWQLCPAPKSIDRIVSGGGV